MALKTNFTDDILAESMNGKRQYNVTDNSNGTKSLEDVTDYQSVGSTLSAKDMNETNAAVNQAYDDMGDEFNSEVDYAVGDYTIRNNKVWKFTTAHPAGAWDESHVKATKILSEARELTEKMNYPDVDDEIIIGSFNGKVLYRKRIVNNGILNNGQTITVDGMVALVNAHGFGYMQNNYVCTPLGFSDSGNTIFVVYSSNADIVTAIYYGGQASALNNATVYIDYIKSL